MVPRGRGGAHARCATPQVNGGLFLGDTTRTGVVSGITRS
jgi:hypothetical protein